MNNRVKEPLEKNKKSECIILGNLLDVLKPPMKPFKNTGSKQGIGHIHA